MRVLDAEVAEAVMGWESCYEWTLDGSSNGNWVGNNGESEVASVPEFSTSIADAFAVVEKMVTEGHVFIIKGDGLRMGDHNPKWTVLVDNYPRIDGHELPRAICVAALAAKQPSA